MKPNDALNELAKHLLGEDWYIVDPVGPEQAAEIILETIRGKYTAVNENPVDAYRRKHKKCVWCKHVKMRTCFDRYGGFDKFYECSAKGVIVNEKANHPFCKLFELDL